MMALLVCVNAWSVEPEVTCKEVSPKKPPSVRTKEPLVQEISITCGNQTVSQTAPEKTPDKKERDDASFSWGKIVEEIFKLIGTLSWPVAAVLIAYLFKKELAAMLARLKKGKFGSAEFEFENYVREVDAEADIPRAPENESISPTAAARASTDPRGAIVSAWIEVEDELFNLVRRRDLSEQASSPRQSKNTVWAIRAVQKAQALDSNWIALFHDLRTLRNEAAHSTDFSPPPEAVIKYVQLAKELANAMRVAAIG
ncbi:hypothetical protein [Rhodocyclus tenuis]|uniref:DUF4145 domain-containing protein n=1 Tax=Rhodocyclus tenuis TaxID=1066 RepID=A0A840G8S7_RHOTE|nr:hypothetical protein [Rhodocyclus tenuis]MBB4248256.1 hypothetical protein [Rhodocyclus tenuis]